MFLIWLIYDRLTTLRRRLLTSCFLNTIQHKLNISVHKKNRFSSNQVGRSESFGLYRKVIEKVYTGRQFFLYHGMTMEDYTFATVVESKPQKSFQGLIKPFDKSTWIFLFIWTFIFIIFVFFTKRTQNIKLELAFLIIEQSGHGLSLEKTKRICLWIYFSWSILAILLSSSYKGKVFELISNPTYPPAPWFVEDIVDMGYVVTSSTSFGIPGRYWNSIIRSKIAEIVEDANAGIQTIHDLDTYLQLNESLIWNRMNRSQYLGNLLLDGILHDKISNKTIEVKNNPVVYIDFTENVKLLQQLVTIVTDKKCTFGEELSAFGTRWHFLTKQEWYARLVGPYFATYAESGIQARWQWFESVRKTFGKLIYIRIRWRHEDAKMGKQMQSAKVLANLLAGKKMIRRRPSPESIGLDHFRVLGTPMLYLLLLAMIFFVGEICWLNLLDFFHMSSKVKTVKDK